MSNDKLDLIKDLGAEFLFQLILGLFQKALYVVSDDLTRADCNNGNYLRVITDNKIAQSVPVPS